MMTPLALDIEVDDGVAVVRVLTALRRRGCRIRRVDYEAEDRHRPGHLVVVVDAPVRHAHCVVAWVENLVDVKEVSDRFAAAGRAERVAR